MYCSEPNKISVQSPVITHSLLELFMRFLLLQTKIASGFVAVIPFMACNEFALKQNPIRAAVKTKIFPYALS